MISKIFYYSQKIFMKLLSKLSPNLFVKAYGVHVGHGGRYLDVSTRTFGTEPYLISLGNKVSISEGVRFITHDGAVWVARNSIEKFKNADLFGEIKVGDNVFIGMNVTILPNVTIGNNCIIGAGSLVCKDVPENTVNAGVPAKYICSVDDYINRKSDLFLYTKHMSPQEKKQYLEQRHVS